MTAGQAGITSAPPARALKKREREDEDGDDEGEGSSSSISQAVGKEGGGKREIPSPNESPETGGRGAKGYKEMESSS